MPVKRRVAKRRVDPQSEAAAWECLFDTGYDFFRDLADVEVETDAYGQVSRETAEAAWQRLGGFFLRDHVPDPHRQPWALAQFGDPHAA